MMPTRKLSIAIFGPTASGKTKLGVTIAKACLGEVISIDSLQCYKPGGIATAKPCPGETQGVPHHLIDYLDAEEEPHDFVSRAIATIDGITTRNRLPVLVGGSTSLIIPLLQQVFAREYEVLIIFLVPHQSGYGRLIESRGGEMLERGLLDELAELKRLEKVLLDGKSDFNKGVWKTIGYREFLPYLRAVGKVNGVSNTYEDLYEEGRVSMNASTLRYGQYQLEWIRHTLTPFIDRHKAATISLCVTDQASWASDIERPAMTMAGEFYHGPQVRRLPSRNSSNKRVVCLLSEPLFYLAPLLPRSLANVGTSGGSSSGRDESHIEAAKSLAVALHRHEIALVYGGGTTGIMGAVSSTLVALSGPGAVHGIVPAALARYEDALGDGRINAEYSSQFGRRTIVRDMHTRKRLMTQAVLEGAPGSGFVALSGGYGTMEELLEITTWYQLGIQDRRVTVFNVNGFYDGLLSWIGQVARDGFVRPRDANIIGVGNTADEVIACLANERLDAEKPNLEWL